MYFPALDGLRAIAFLSVFFHHYGYMTFGWFGVDCFFVLSGFLITGILFDTVDQPHRVRNFYVRRTLRIFPLFYAVFAVLLLAYPLVHWQWDRRWLLWPAYFANFIGFFPHVPIDLATANVLNGVLPTRSGFVLNLGHFWSLCVEEQFYLVWPSIVFFVRRRRPLLWICAAAIVICPMLRILALTSFPARWLETGVLLRGTPFRLDTLLFGAAAALLYRGPHRARLLAIARPLAWAAALLFVVALRPPYLLVTAFAGQFIETIGLSLVALLSTGVVLRLLTPASRLYRPFCSRPLRWVGRISYGAYVFHDIPHSVYSRLTYPHRGGTMLVALAGTLLLASASYRFLETPFLRLKDRLSPAPA